MIRSWGKPEDLLNIDVVLFDASHEGVVYHGDIHLTIWGTIDDNMILSNEITSSWWWKCFQIIKRRHEGQYRHGPSGCKMKTNSCCGMIIDATRSRSILSKSSNSDKSRSTIEKVILSMCKLSIIKIDSNRQECLT